MTTPESGIAPPLAAVDWRPCHRLIPSRFPPIALFERVADPADWDALYAVESLTNSRLRDEVGEISLVPPEDRVSGPGATFLMAPFTHLTDTGGRFSTSRFGAYYAARDVETAIHETVYHRERFLRATREPPIEIDMRELRADLVAELHDVRGMQSALSAVYDPLGYSASQALASRLRASGSDGIAWDSVRHAGGECAAVFRPRRLANCRQSAHFCYAWNGARIDRVYEKSGLRTI